MDEYLSFPSKQTPKKDELQDLAYAVSHDLQAPLRHVSSFLNLLKSAHATSLNEEGQQFVNIALQSAHRLQSMLNALLELSRISSDPTTFTCVDLNTCLEAIFRANAQHPSAYQLICGPLPKVMGCPEQLRVLFQHILENVEHHNSTFDDLTATISAKQVEGFALIAVSDNGVGIPAEHHQRVFDMFQTYKANKEARLGSGLSIAQRIAQLHGGSLSYEKKGSDDGRFIVKLKLA